MLCALCQNFAKHPLIEAGKAFCCAGCRAVFNILEMRGEAFHVEHPLYLEALKEGIISNPMRETPKMNESGERCLLEIGGMGCPSCAEVIGYFLNKKEGVIGAKIDYSTDLALIEYDPMKIGLEAILERIRSIGYEPLFLKDRGKRDRRLLLELGVAAFSALNLMMVAYPLYTMESGGREFAMVSFFFALPVVFFSSLPFYKRAYNGLRAGIFGMDLLASVSVLAAFILSTWNLVQGNYTLYYETLSIIVAFLLFGKWIEKQAKESGKERFYEMVRHLPQKVRTEEGETRLLKEVKVGDRLLIALGEMVPVKSVVVKGSLWVSEQAINGEMTPKLHSEGDILKSGAIVESGQAVIGAQEVYENSLIHRVVEACELSFNRRSEGFSFLNAFVPFLLMLALFTFFAFGFERALATLLISCPCAIGLAAPLVRSRLLKAFAERGALVRNFDAFENLAKGELFIFDKTGTVTEGKLTLIREPAHKGILKGLARLSAHPLARSLSKFEGEAQEFDQVQEYIGKGIVGIKEGVEYTIGSDIFLKERGIANPFNSENTHIILAIGSQAVECLEFVDVIRAGLDLPEPRLLLSGDQEPVVKKIAHRLGFKEWYSGYSPLEKEAFIRARKENTVYIGDGLNDAPSLAASSCGIAVGEAMSLTQASADIVLVRGQLNELNNLIYLAQNGNKKIAQNYFWAFFYNGVCIPLAVLGYLTPLIATVVMGVSSLFVIVNSLKIKGGR